MAQVYQLCRFKDSRFLGPNGLDPFAKHVQDHGGRCDDRCVVDGVRAHAGVHALRREAQLPIVRTMRKRTFPLCMRS